ILWVAGWVGPEAQPTAAAVPPSVTNGLSDLSDRMGKVETRLSSVPATSDNALRAQVDVLEHSITTLRDQSAALRKQVESASAALAELKSAPRDGGAPAD